MPQPDTTPLADGSDIRQTVASLRTAIACESEQGALEAATELAVIVLTDLRRIATSLETVARHMAAER